MLLISLLFVVCFVSFAICFDDRVKSMLDDELFGIAKHSKIYNKALKRWSERHASESNLGIKPHHLHLPMRDGVDLYTVYVTPDIIFNEKNPTVLIRSPYGTDGTENLALLWIPLGFNCVMQNERGTGKSGGNW